PVGTTVTTPGGTPAAVLAGGPVPGVVILKAGADPLGTISLVTWTGASAMGGTNMATSTGFPWTVGKIVISQPGAVPAEKFTITGKDNRTAKGAGHIQLVSGSLSARTTSGFNGNRGWVRLQLKKLGPVPSMSPPLLATAAGLIVLASAYVARRRFLS
ncbi:MAG: hypothetical protein JRG90_20025, partial [Deltaproteobacteria bacterium]|nr:hypothetical protein [Deltaproteobacteria bacterium]